MKTSFPRHLLTLMLIVPLPLWAQAQTITAPSQAQMLESSDAHLAANKKLVYDFWREVIEAGHLDLANRYLAENYIQHNPNVPTGRAGFVEFFAKLSKPSPIQAQVQAPLIAIVAEGDRVILSFVQPEKGYNTTWFDMFRIDNGHIAEHWDPALKE